MLLRRRSELTENDVTPQEIFQERRRFIQTMGVLLGTAWTGRIAFPDDELSCEHNLSKDALSASGEALNSQQDIKGYNNYYEFSTNKKAIRILAQELTIDPWTVTVEGEVENPVTLDIDDLRKRFGSEERIYRLRCVEGWSMVIPWSGFSLCHLLKLVKPTSAAKYVEFVSLHRSTEMIGQRQNGSLQWPYREGLRIDEAMHPLSFMVTGLYGEELPKQNGSPLRLAVPWKYGFKSSKAVTHIRLTQEQPTTSWSLAIPSEYGFYANVNPDVSHPRWSQRREVRIGEIKKRQTLPFNGYADEVAELYRGMDLSKYF